MSRFIFSSLLFLTSLFFHAHILLKASESSQNGDRSIPNEARETPQSSSVATTQTTTFTETRYSKKQRLKEKLAEQKQTLNLLSEETATSLQIFVYSQKAFNDLKHSIRCPQVQRCFWEFEDLDKTYEQLKRKRSLQLYQYKNLRQETKKLENKYTQLKKQIDNPSLIVTQPHPEIKELQEQLANTLSLIVWERTKLNLQAEQNHRLKTNCRNWSQVYNARGSNKLSNTINSGYKELMACTELLKGKIPKQDRKEKVMLETHQQLLASIDALLPSLSTTT